MISFSKSLSQLSAIELVPIRVDRGQELVQHRRHWHQLGQCGPERKYLGTDGHTKISSYCTLHDEPLHCLHVAMGGELGQGRQVLHGHILVDLSNLNGSVYCLMAINKLQLLLTNLGTSLWDGNHPRAFCKNPEALSQQELGEGQQYRQSGHLTRQAETKKGEQPTPTAAAGGSPWTWRRHPLGSSCCPRLA